MTHQYSWTSTTEKFFDVSWVRIFRSSSRMTHLRAKMCDLRCLHHWIQANQVDNLYMLPSSARLAPRHFVTTITSVVNSSTFNRKTVCCQLKIHLGTWQCRQFYNFLSIWHHHSENQQINFLAGGCCFYNSKSLKTIRPTELFKHHWEQFIILLNYYHMIIHKLFLYCCTPPEKLWSD